LFKIFRGLPTIQAWPEKERKSHISGGAVAKFYFWTINFTETTAFNAATKNIFNNSSFYYCNIYGHPILVSLSDTILSWHCSFDKLFGPTNVASTGLIS
jgi:hypothetical protein